MTEEWNPLDWAAGPFLSLYVMVALAALGLVAMSRLLVGGSARGRERPLGLAELAFLAGGRVRMADAALVGLLAARAARADDNGRTVDITGWGANLPAELEPFRTITRGRTTRREFAKLVQPVAAAVQDRLAGWGLAPSTRASERWQGFAMAVLAVPLLGGGAKVLVGWWRDRPVGILIVLLLGTLLCGWLVAKDPPFRTASGARALRRNREENARAARAPLDGELALAVALGGLAVLTGTEFAAYARAAAASGGSSGCGGSSDSSSSDGGSGCGGGGCGGCSG